MRRLTYYALAAASGVAALALAFLPTTTQRINLYVNGSAWWAAAALLVLAAVLAWRMKGWRREPDASRAADAVFALVLAGVITALVPARYFIEQDESSMLGTAQSLALNHTPVATSQGVFRDDGALLSTALVIDKRGMFYPVLVAAADTLIGKSLWNPARINLLLGIISIFLALRLARRYVQADAARAAVVMFTSFTVFPITMRGGTLDFCNTAFLFLLLHALCCFLRRPDRSNVALLVAVSTVAALNRYETVGLSSLAILIAHANGLRLARRRDALMALAPLFIVPATWRFAIPMDYDLPGPWFNAWAMNNIPDNIERLLAWLLSPAGLLTGSVATGWLAVIGMILLSLRWIRNPERQVSLATLAPPGILGFLLAILMASYWGQATSVITVRYFIPLTLVIGILAGYAIAESCRAATMQVRRIIMICIPSLIWAANAPQMLQPQAYLESNFYRFRDNSVAAIRQQYAQCNVLLLSINNPMFLSRQISSITPMSYEMIGLKALLAASRQSIQTVIFSIPLRNATQLLPPEIVQRWGTSAIRFRYGDGDHGVDLVQLWPDHPIDPAQCPRIPQNRALIDMPGINLLRSWVNASDRWDPASARHRALRETHD